MEIQDRIGAIPYRLALAGGWIDQPFVSRLHPSPPGAMVVVGLEPRFRFMERAGMATSTRRAAARLWGGRLPEGDAAALVRTLYHVENESLAEPSGSQDMAGLIYPGASLLEYDPAFEGGYFPSRIESLTGRDTAAWLESVLSLLPVNQRPQGYQPLAVKRLDPAWIKRLGDAGFACFEAVRGRDLAALGASLNETMLCWEALLPDTVSPPGLDVDLMGLWQAYRERHAGAMYSGCGGGYLIVASAESVPGSIRIKVRS